ncbi:sodium-dependent bicarbonate transport family permease [Thiomicrorhabdus aquaedulcis]|uniref:sodium-dependent bicarbonate transport family permease n=1 Tax=Thiomicrorhabdus aquaedulcis TaxID=2211106 RepID=UPI0022B2ABB0|nr:sodium-dependent bicarbonate transport family permease [Thiomicrorhabdus aquaedulcis]
MSSLLIPAVLFFALGFFAKVIKSDLKFPPEMGKVLAAFLLIGIGIKGGVALSTAELLPAINSIIVALVLGLTIPLIAFVWLAKVAKFNIFDSAAISAHYGSVSAGTFLVAIAFLDSMKISYESYPLIMLAIMESPAIIIGLLLASYARKTTKQKNPQIDCDDDENRVQILAAFCTKPLPTAVSSCF